MPALRGIEGSRVRHIHRGATQRITAKRYDACGPREADLLADDRQDEIRVRLGRNWSLSAAAQPTPQSPRPSGRSGVLHLVEFVRIRNPRRRFWMKSQRMQTAGDDSAKMKTATRKIVHAAQETKKARPKMNIEVPKSARRVRG